MARWLGRFTADRLAWSPRSSTLSNRVARVERYSVKDGDLARVHYCRDQFFDKAALGAA